MSRCILHYGMPKTGSSSIQTWLLRELQDPRFHYLNLGRRGSGNLLVSAFLQDPAAHHRNRKRGIDAAALTEELTAHRTQLSAQLRALDGRTAIFSAELLAGIRDTELAAITAMLGTHCATLQAVGYVRAPVSFMESVYQQRLKAGNPALQLRALYPRYRERLGKFETVLGADSVAYWRFEPQEFPRGCVVRDFCARLAIGFEGQDVPRVNDSLSLDAISLLYAYRRFGPGYGSGEAAMRENRDLKECLLQLQGPKLRLHAAAVAAVLEENRDDIRWMEERLGSTLVETPTEDPRAVRTETDLLHFSTAALDWLGATLARPPLPANVDPQRVADEMHRLRVHLAERKPAEPGSPRSGSMLGRVWQRLRGA